ncbi:MAG: class II aldolase/adducin family protein [Roseinatronobacter sp.]
MIANLWQDKQAAAFQDAAGPDPMARELALRVYTSRLIGQDPDLVMHGGGNTSVKLRARDVMGHEIDVLHVKGSGWDLETIEAEGLPAVRLAPLMELHALDAPTDEAMVTVQHANLLDSTAPNPSVETLLNACLPPRCIDHTHATAFLTLANLPELAEVTRDYLATVWYWCPISCRALRCPKRQRLCSRPIRTQRVCFWSSTAISHGGRLRRHRMIG